MVNDAVAYIRSLAELRGRNADWAEQAVRERGEPVGHRGAAAARHRRRRRATCRSCWRSSTGARYVSPPASAKLATRGLTVDHVKPDWRTELLAVITNPTVAYGLMLIGIYGLLFEGYNPGAVLPGVVGAICLLIALFAFQILSVNYAGLALVAARHRHDRRGVLLPDVRLARHRRPHRVRRRLAHPVRYGRARAECRLPADRSGRHRRRPVMIVGIVYARQPRHAPPGRHRRVQGMIGASAEVVRRFSGKGRVRYGGELWNARSAAALQAGQTGAHRDGGRTDIVGRAQ